MGISRVHTSRLPAPYPSNCWTMSEEESYNISIYSELYHVDYSRDACLKTCYQQHVVKECSCGDYKIPMEGNTAQSLSNHTIQPAACSTTQQRKCEISVKNKWIANNLNCRCNL